MNDTRDDLDVDFAGVYSGACGCMPRTCEPCEKYSSAVLMGRVELIPRSRWVEVFAEDVPVAHYTTGIKNQGNYGTCASQSASTCVEAIIRHVTGLSVPCSAISIYQEIASSGQSGTTIFGNLDQLVTVGCLPEDTPENRRFLRTVGLNENHVMPNSAYGTRYPWGWKETANHFKLDRSEVFELQSFDEIVSAVGAGWHSCYGRNMHSIWGCGCDGKNLIYKNSWANFGFPYADFPYGFGRDSERVLSRGVIANYGAWAARSLLDLDFWLEAKQIMTQAGY
jgi:hypothetical protein